MLKTRMGRRERNGLRAPKVRDIDGEGCSEQRQEPRTRGGCGVTKRIRRCSLGGIDGVYKNALSIAPGRCDAEDAQPCALVTARDPCCQW